MINVITAQQLIRNNIKPLPPVNIPLHAAAGKVLYKDIYAPMALPPFAQSAMDGYAFCFSDWKNSEKLPLSGTIAAGNTIPATLPPGTCMRIFTGAPLPQGADTVIQQELVNVADQQISILNDALEKGANIRPIGSEVQAGRLAISSGTVLTPGATGYLANMGIDEVQVHSNPKVTILVTGNELQEIGKPLEFGQVYESNSLALKAALEKYGIHECKVCHARDEASAIVQALKAALAESDMVLITGGVSVGGYDFVVEATQQCGVVQHFHKISQKPGKPLYFGTLGEKVVFGLPGNPGSVMTCYYIYVRQAIQCLTGRKEHLNTFQVPLAAALQSKTGITQFFKGWYQHGVVWPTGAQESFRMSAFAQANCLIVAGDDCANAEQHALVEIIWLDDI